MKHFYLSTILLIHSKDITMSELTVLKNKNKALYQQSINLYKNIFGEQYNVPPYAQQNNRVFHTIDLAILYYQKENQKLHKKNAYLTKYLPPKENLKESNL